MLQVIQTIEAMRAGKCLDNRVTETITVQTALDMKLVSLPANKKRRSAWAVAWFWGLKLGQSFK